VKIFSCRERTISSRKLRPSRTAIQIQHERRHAVTGNRAQAERGRDGHRGQGMGRIQFAMDDLVPDRGPAELAAQLHPQAVLLIEAKLPGHDERRAIRQRHEPQAQLLSHGGSLGGRLAVFIQTVCDFHRWELISR